MNTRLCWLCVFVTLTLACSKTEKEAIAENEARARADKEASDLFARKRHCYEIGESRQKKDEAEASELDLSSNYLTTSYCYSPTLNTCLYRHTMIRFTRFPDNKHLGTIAYVVDALTNDTLAHWSSVTSKPEE